MGGKRAGKCFQRYTCGRRGFAIYRLFGELHGQRRVGRDLLRQFTCAVVQLIDGQDFVDKTPSFGCFSRYALSRKNHLFCAAIANQVRQAPGTSPARNRSNRYFRESQLSRISSEPNIGGQGQFQTAA